MTVGTADGLRKVSKHFQKGVPIILDDVTPSARRGTRGSMPIDEIKHLSNVRDCEVVDARSNDIVIFSDQPRIFTSNASTPSEWHDCLFNILDLRNLSDEQRLKKCSHDTRALFKRCMFVQFYDSVFE